MHRLLWRRNPYTNPHRVGYFQHYHHPTKIYVSTHHSRSHSSKSHTNEYHSPPNTTIRNSSSSSLQEGYDDYEEEEDLSKATPWRNLLYHPARALWRTTPPYALSNYPTSTTTTAPPTDTTHSNIPPIQVQKLLQEQYQILQISQRTKKQLYRSHEKLLTRQLDYIEQRQLTIPPPQTPKQEKLPHDSIAATSNSSSNPISTRFNSNTLSLGYKPEQTCVYLHHRLLPNYFVLERIFRELQHLRPNKTPLSITKMVDFGVGCGSASAAALQVFDSIQWIHGIDASQSMREVSGRILERLTMDSDVRVTMGETLLSGSSSGGGTTAFGTFDLALFCHTAQDIPSLPAILSSAAMLWEKLDENGIFVMVEPGTPDGFQSIRAVREMLLECCPPSSLEDSSDSSEEELREEAHVLAPCTHNGTCPMNPTEWEFPQHLKRPQGNQITKQENASEFMELEFADLQYDSDDDEDMALLADGWVEYDPSSETHDVSTTITPTHEEDDDPDALELQNGKQDEYDMDDLSKRDYLRENDIFAKSFCSFVHALPSQDLRRGQWTKKKGEKFSYIVIQKRVVGGPESIHDQNDTHTHDDDDEDNNDSKIHDETQRSVPNVNIVDLLAETMDVSDRIHTKMMKNTNYGNTSPPTETEEDIADRIKLQELLSQAISLEKSFMKSNDNELGLEYVNASSHVYNDTVKSSADTTTTAAATATTTNISQTIPWGRLVRAPLKKKGHISIDYCTGSPNKMEGRIVRHQVSKGKSSRMAPGLYAAARKARWGGLWPDLATYDATIGSDGAIVQEEELELDVDEI